MQDHHQKRSAFFRQVVGKYYLVSQENFEEYLKAIGKLTPRTSNFVIRSWFHFQYD